MLTLPYDHNEEELRECCARVSAALYEKLKHKLIVPGDTINLTVEIEVVQGVRRKMGRVH